MSSIENLCIFHKSNGNIIFRNLNINSREKEEHYIFDNNLVEYINYNDVFIEELLNNIKVYKKYHYYENDIKKFKMLEWKETTHKDWDWFIVNKVNGNVVNIINFIEEEKIKQLKLTYDDLINKINSLIETYELPKNKNNELKDTIKESIYNFVHTL